MSRRLRSRIVLAFGGFAVFVTAIFGLSTAIFLYTAEDRFFNEQLAEEAALLEQSRARDARWGVPRHSYMTVHESFLTMPADLRRPLTAEPWRREFPGDAGRHYHVRPLADPVSSDSTARAWLVAEVSDRLVVRPMRSDLLGRWLVVNAGILLLAIGIALRIARRVARPLSSLAEAVRAFDPARSTSPITIDGADDEVAVVARSLEEMRARVQEFVSREQAFTRDASHELRTPLSVIRSTTAQALDDPGSSPASRRLLMLALQSAEHMERTIAGLLLLAREAALERPDVPCRILPVLEQVVLEQSAALEGRAVSLAIEVPADATLDVSEAVLHILLSNVIGNAFAHASPGTVRVCMRGRLLMVCNPMIPEVMPDVETLGVPGVKRAESPGFGLGLSIVRRLCEKAGLSLSLQVIPGGEFQLGIGPGVRV